MEYTINTISKTITFNGSSLLSEMISLIENLKEKGVIDMSWTVHHQTYTYYYSTPITSGDYVLPSSPYCNGGTSNGLNSDITFTHS